MKRKITALLTVLSLMLTGCGSISGESVHGTVPVAEIASDMPQEDTETSVQTQAPETEVTSETTREDAETSVQTQAPETEVTSETTRESAETSVKQRKFTTATEPPPEMTDKGPVIYQRPDPEYEVSAEDFEVYEEEIGFHLSVPEGAEKIAYRIDAESYKGTLIFYLGDVLWDAKVMPADEEVFYRPYVDEYMTELDCDLESDRFTKVHGVEGDIRYYKITYSDTKEAYKLDARWYLEDEGYLIEMGCLSDEPIHSMPIEVFG